MSIDLIAKRKSSKTDGLHYNLHGWGTLLDHLEKWGVDLSKIPEDSTGHPINAKTCMAIANAIDVHFEELSADDREWLTGHAKEWHWFAKVGGCLQF